MKAEISCEAAEKPFRAKDKSHQIFLATAGRNPALNLASSPVDLFRIKKTFSAALYLARTEYNSGIPQKQDPAYQLFRKVVRPPANRG